MADMKQIHDFAVKWCDKFRNQNINYIELVDHYMADDCDALGFEMDCGHAFSEKYGNAANNHEALDRIIDDVTDIPLLGSAIYSQWRYFNLCLLRHNNHCAVIVVISVGWIGNDESTVLKASLNRPFAVFGNGH